MISGRPSSGAGNCSGTVVITFRSACMQFELGLNGLWNHFATDTSGWADFLCKWFEQAICLRWIWMDFEATMQLVQVVLSDHCQVAVHRKLQKVTVSYKWFDHCQVVVHRRFPLVTVSYGTPSVQFKIAFNLLWKLVLSLDKLISCSNGLIKHPCCYLCTIW